MPIYITLFRFTERGMQNIKQAPDMLDLNRQGFGPVLGVRMKEVFLVTGQYDGVAVLEADNDEAVAKMLLTVGSFGNVRTETMRAFTEEEFRKLIPALP